MSSVLRRWCAWAGLLVIAGCGDCGDSAGVDTAAELPDAHIARRDAGRPLHLDAGSPTPPFVAADPPAPIPAHNENPALDAGQIDAAIPGEDGATPAGSPDGCIAIAAGDAMRIDGELTDARRWLRIDPDDGCPAALVTADEVAYAAYVLCEEPDDRTLTLSMLGTDRLPGAPPDGVADPMLVVYTDEAQLTDDPFACSAVNDDGVFDGFVSNSARIEGLQVPAGMRLVVVATSFEPPEQHGVGSYSLELAAQ